MIHWPILVASVISILSICIASVPVLFGVSGDFWLAAGLVFFVIGLFATGALPGHVTALLFFLFGMLFSVAPSSIIFAGFQSNALWLVFGGLLIGLAVERTGLAARMAELVSCRFALGYWRLLSSMVGLGVLMSFVMPSSVARIVVIMPVAISLAERVGFERGSEGYKGIILATGLGVLLPAFGILPANIVNVILVGASESLYQLETSYGFYLLTHFPVLGFMKAILIVGVVGFFYRDEPRVSAQVSVTKPLSKVEWRLLILLMVAVGLWLTDFAHRISPAWIALTAGLLCLVPRFGILHISVFEKDINYTIVLYVAGVIGLGAMVSESGLGIIFGNALTSIFDFRPGESFGNYLRLSVATSLLGLVTTQPGVPAVVAPLAEVLANSTGMSLIAILSCQVVGFSTLILPYQTPPLVLAAQLGGVSVGDMAKCTLVLAGLSLLLVIPLDFVWLTMLGVIE